MKTFGKLSKILQKLEEVVKFNIKKKYSNKDGKTWKNTEKHLLITSHDISSENLSVLHLKFNQLFKLGKVKVVEFLSE